MIAKTASSVTELSILEKLTSVASKDPGSQHITTLLDTFQHGGPNGKHQCLVVEAMGATTASLVEELQKNKPKMYGKVYPKWLAKKILLHTLRGLAFLHRNGIVHGDVQPGNLLFSVQSIDDVQEDELVQDKSATAIPLQRLDGKTDRWAPKVLYLKQPLHDRITLTPDLLVKLSDFGSGIRTHPVLLAEVDSHLLITSAFWAAHPPDATVTPVALRAPETILRQSFGTGIEFGASAASCLSS